MVMRRAGTRRVAETLVDGAVALGDLFIGGTVDLQGALGVLGNVNFSGSLNVGDATTLNELGVAGPATFDDVASFTGGVLLSAFSGAPSAPADGLALLYALLLGGGKVGVHVQFETGGDLVVVDEP